MIRRTARIAAAFVLLTLAACTSIPLGATSGPRSLDYLNDDFASLLLAFDVPLTLEPVADGSVLNFDVTTPASGARHIEAALTAADAGDLAGTLPPPAAERNYYLFGFSDADKAAIREAQAWARTLPPGSNEMTISLSPGFCRTSEIDPSRVNVSVLIALPGVAGLSPLISSQSLGSLLASSPIKEIPACAGHSG